MEYVKGLVSVVIPTYKRSDTLSRAIESVLKQTYEKIECIVVNDNNPGDEFSQILYKVVENYKDDSRFQFIEQEVHKNGAAARNVGIRAARGEYIAFLDDDDYWDENKAEVQVGVLKELSQEWGAVSCLMRQYRKGKIYAANFPYKDGFIHYEVLTRCISMGTGSLVIRRKALDETGYFDESLRRYQDPQLFSCLTERYKVKLIKRYLHNRDVDDAQNRATIDNINAFQVAFFKSVAPQLKRLPKFKVRQLKIIYDFDKSIVYWRDGERREALKLIMGIFKCPSTIRFVANRILNRMHNRLFIDRRLKKYQ